MSSLSHHCRARCLFVVSVVAMALVTTGCDTGSRSYFPLDADRYWQYAVTRTTMDGSVTQKYLIETTSPTTWQGREVSVRRTMDGSRFLYVADPADGIMRVAARLRDDDTFRDIEPPEIILPADPGVGASWTRTISTKVLENSGPPWETLFRINHPVALDYTVESTTATVTVPAGRFENCLLVRGHGQAGTDVGNYIGRVSIVVSVADWFAPGVGLVRSERTESTDAKALDRGTSVMELEFFR